MKRERLWLVVILLFGTGLRLFNLGEQSLWYDEGVSWYLSQFNLPDLVAWTAADIQPPLYYLILWLAVRLFGDSEWALRLPSVIFGVLTIPLMWRLGRRLLPRLNPAIPAALLTALAPVMVYYSQEARMYTLLVMLVVAGSYLLIQSLTLASSRQQAMGYSVVMAAALYTHYFALFVLVAHGLYAFLKGVKNPDVALKKVAGMFVGVGVLFAPWLPVLAARLTDDPSYWRGSLKLPEIIADIGMSFAVGGKREMIFEAQGLWLTAGFAVLLLASAALLSTQRRQRDRLVFLMLWLLLPIVAIVLLSYNTPKFNPRYTLMAWPPFALIVAGGLTRLYHATQTKQSRQTPAAVFLTLALGFITAAWSFSLQNWFFDPRFSKDDFQALAQFVKERSRPGDTVLLSSGHLFPVWQYYAPDDNWTPLPQMERLDVNQVTDLNIIPTLSNALQGDRGAWLVTWQDEVIDPNGVIPFLLDSGATRLNDEFHRANFWGVGLAYWQLPSTPTFPINDLITTPTDANFGNLVTLNGLAQQQNERVTLFWTPQQSLTEAYRVSLRLVDDAQVEWSAGTITAAPGNDRYPTNRWPERAMIAAPQRLPWLPGTPPGRYWLEVGWVDEAGNQIDILDVNGNPQRPVARLGPVGLTEPAPGLEIDPAGTSLGDLKLREANWNLPDVEAGGKIIFEGIWQVQQPAATPLRLIGWQNEGGQTYPLSPTVSISANYAAGTAFRSRHKLSTPYQAPPGDITLLGEIDGDTHPLGIIRLTSTTRNFAPPAELAITTTANFNNQANLLGANLPTGPYRAGDVIPLTLYWRAGEPFDNDLTTFVHLLGENGTPVVNADHAPPRATTNWIEGEIIADTVEIALPDDLPPGRYPLEVGLYNSNDPAFTRLPRRDEATDYIILTSIQVQP